SDMFRLLSELRRLPDVVDCYTFGATLHVVGADGFDPAKTTGLLKSAGLADARIYPAEGNIEDLFIKLTHNESR
ncbi:MAG: ABC transporter ATP-binding protein, partial [Muribaculaceae bacterium]|nr:ABC transporter ATP-binding protein [Muribaculaceae bacterium]